MPDVIPAAIYAAASDAAAAAINAAFSGPQPPLRPYTEIGARAAVEAACPLITEHAAAGERQRERERIDAGLDAIAVRFARPALDNGTLGGWEEHVVVPIGQLSELVHAGCIRCQNLDGTISPSCYCREDVIEPVTAGRWEAWTKPMPCGDSPDEHFQAGVLFGIAAERQRWERLCQQRAGASREAARICRLDGQDEQAEIYVGQALAYDSLPGLLGGEAP